MAEEWKKTLDDVADYGVIIAAINWPLAQVWNMDMVMKLLASNAVYGYYVFGGLGVYKLLRMLKTF